MSKFSKKIVSLASSLLAFTSLAGSAKAALSDHSPYPGYDFDHHTFWNAIKASQEDFDDYTSALTDDEQNALRDTTYFVANRISNHPKTAIGATVGTASLIAAYKLGVFDGLLGSKGNKKHVKAYFNNNNFDDEDDDIEEYDDNYQDPYNQNY